MSVHAAHAEAGWPFSLGFTQELNLWLERKRLGMQVLRNSENWTVRLRFHDGKVVVKEIELDPWRLPDDAVREVMAAW